MKGNNDLFIGAFENNILIGVAVGSDDGRISRNSVQFM
jgi:hypothetical protein